MARNDRVVQPVHAHADGAAALDVGLLHKDHAERWVLLLGLDGRHGAAGAATDHKDIGFDLMGNGLAHKQSPR